MNEKAKLFLILLAFNPLTVEAESKIFKSLNNS